MMLFIPLQVNAVQKYKDEPVPEPTPVLSPQTFCKLCATAPIQGSSSRLRPSSAVPLSLEELRPPQLLLGLDAEFVALSAPGANIRGCVSSQWDVQLTCCHVVVLMQDRALKSLQLLGLEACLLPCCDAQARKSFQESRAG